MSAGYVNPVVFNAQTLAASVASGGQSADRCLGVRVTALFGGDTVTGTFKIQVSNVPPGQGSSGPLSCPIASDDPSWVDAPDSTASATLTEAGTVILYAAGPFRWFQLVWTISGSPAGTVTAYAYGFGPS